MKTKILLLFIYVNCFLSTVYSQEYLRTDGSNKMKGSLEINRSDVYSSIELKSGVGGFIDFTSDYTSDYNGRLIWNYNNSNRFDIYGNVNFNNSVDLKKVVTNDLTVRTQFFLYDPKRISDWNLNWGSSFIESYNAENAPESSGWFWGLNMNHGSNHEEYRYNGQLAVKNSATNPTMYFRSTGKDGSGTWAKVINDHGDQYIDGGLTLNGKLLSKEVKVQATIDVPDYVFKEDYELKSLEEVKDFIDKNSHLPEVPSEKTIKEEGINVGEMNLILLKKIEELTLYLLKQQEVINDYEQRLKQLEQKNN
ncbi:hypothetical protein [Flammeovirga sp. SJP92]|uniref:hypothetical protein n=1 Tax=Flammeovirga sp. SJP92 TaxID=1775430 RepID=UPI000787A085|nr:hypothetical protein [Flammeovirga sp. SJP92]KXX71226.1 hypothetical protein AVL50_09220 [Flammeovirga sp. SJP92]